MDLAANAPTANASSNLKHIYFFIDQTESDVSTPMDSPALPSDPAPKTPKPSSRDSSPGSTGASSSNADMSGSGSSTTSSSFNPNAAAFSPRLSKQGSVKPWAQVFQPPTPQYEQRHIEGKGQGLVATSLISRGTRIISEYPLVRIPGEHVFLAWGSYCNLNNDQKTAFDKLHCYSGDQGWMRNAARMYLLQSDTSSMKESEIDALIDEQVRVMSIFSCNNFNTAGGLAVYLSTSRINHSCVPNAFHGFNPTLKRFVVHAVRDIAPGEEITISYMGSPATFQVRSQRIEFLRSHYGFTCLCPSCSDETETSNNRREILGAITGGLAEHEAGTQPLYPYIPNGPAQAFDLAVNAVNILNAEGLHTLEFLRALHAASKYALLLQDWHTAIQYAMQEQEVQTTIFGTEVDDLVASKTAASCWIEHIRNIIYSAMGKDQAKKLFKQYRSTPMPTPTPPRPSEKTSPKKTKKKSPEQKEAARRKRQERTAAERLQRAETVESGYVEVAEDSKPPTSNNSKPSTPKAPAKKEDVKPAKVSSWAKVAAGHWLESLQD